jgi:titin
MGNNYKFKVIALNAAGQGETSDESDFIIAATIPDEPTNVLRIQAERSFITIGWQAPSYNGGTPIMGYKVYWDAGQGGLFYQEVADDVFDTLIYTEDEVIQGTTYNFKVVAYNAIGDSQMSLPFEDIAANYPD